MREKRCDCIFVGDSPENVVGILSECNIVHSMALGVDAVKRARDMSFEEVLSLLFITVSIDNYMYVRLSRMSRHDIRYLGVTGQNGRLIDWISSREMVRQRVTNAIVIGNQFSTATQPSDLNDALKAPPTLANALMHDAVPSQHVTALIAASTGRHWPAPPRLPKSKWGMKAMGYRRLIMRC